MRNAACGVDRTSVVHEGLHRGSNLARSIPHSALRTPHFAFTPHSAFRTPHSVGRAEVMGVVDAHVHFWDPAVLHYPWLAGTPLDRAFLPPDYAATAAKGKAPITKLVFVECNCRPEEAQREVK